MTCKNCNVIAKGEVSWDSLFPKLKERCPLFPTWFLGGCFNFIMSILVLSILWTPGLMFIQSRQVENGSTPRKST